MGLIDSFRSFLAMVAVGTVIMAGSMALSPRADLDAATDGCGTMGDPTPFVVVCGLLEYLDAALTAMGALVVWVVSVTQIADTEIVWAILIFAALFILWD